MPAVTISAGYGAGGSVVSRALAERLGYAHLDRAISAEVAQQLRVSVEEAEDGAVKRSFVERFFGTLAPLAGAVIGGEPETVHSQLLPTHEAELFREQAEAIMRRALPAGAVILGRAGAAALVHEPGVLRVRLFGPAGARARQAARLQGIDVGTAEKRLPEVDGARAQYVKRLYQADIDDPALYHLQLDSTAIPLEACVEVLACAAQRTLEGRPQEMSTTTGA